MKPIRTFLIIAGILTAIGVLFSQGQMENVKIKATHVAGNVYMLEGRGGNMGVSVGKDGALLVDDQFAPLSDKIRAAIKKLDPGPLKFVLNTHWHGDHTGGNENFSSEATILAHTNVRKRLSMDQFQPARNRTVPAAPEAAWPVITFDQSVSIHFNGEEIKISHLPAGHTDGDAVVYFTQSKVLHMGDLFFSGRFPFIDLDSGGNVDGYIKDVEEILGMLDEDVRIIPGHGPLSTLDDLKNFHKMLVATTEYVRGQLKAGKSADEIKAAGLPAEWKEWGWSFINENRWIDIIIRGS